MRTTSLRFPAYFAATLMFFFFNSSAQLPIHEWAKQFGQSGSQLSEARSIIADNAGNVYVAGSFTGTHDFDPGPSVYNLSSAAGPDIFILKLDAAGNLVWAKQIAGATGDDIATGITLSLAGEPIITGGFAGSVDFDPGAGVNIITAPGFVQDVFILKLNANGDFVWVRQVGGSETDISASITLDISGNILLTGIFSATADFDPAITVANLNAVSTADNFILKLDAEGNFVWVKQIGGISVFILPQSLKTDANGNVVSAGFFTGNCDFNPGSGVHVLSSLSGYASYILKLDPTGNFLWDAMFKGSSNVYARSLCVDASGSIYSTGSFDFTADFDPGAAVYNLPASFEKGFVSKLDNSGNFVWAKSMADMSKSLALDNIGYAYVIGSAVSQSLTKINNAGNEEWAISLNSSTNSGSILYVDASQNIYTASSFTGTTDFDPGPGVVDLTATAPFEIYVRKLSQLQVVPLRFISFSGMNTQSGVQLSWRFAAATGNSNFVVERSEDGAHFTSLPGLTISSAGQQYACTDATVTNGKNFYRIKYTGPSSETELSKIVSINASQAAAETKIWYTKEGSIITIYSTEVFKNASVQVFDISGKILLSKNKQSGNILPVNIELVPKAIYILKLSDGDRKFVTRIVQ